MKSSKALVATIMLVLMFLLIKDQHKSMTNAFVRRLGDHSAKRSVTNATTGDASQPPLQAGGNRMTLVVAHYKEWMKDDNPLHKIPGWANPEIHTAQNNNQSNYDVHHPFYQRLNSSLPTYVPNYGFESGVYVKYIIDHYDSLPDVVVFTQADCSDAKKNFESIMANLTGDLIRSVGGFLPLNSRKRYGKDFAKLEQRGGGYSRRIEDCWRQVASDFGRDDIFQGFNYSTSDTAGYTPSADTSTHFRINIMCCAIFAVTRDRIRAAAPLERWRAFYDRAIVNGSCVAGRVDLDLGKGETGGAFEHLIAVIFGGKDALWDPFGHGDIVNGNFPNEQQRASKSAVYNSA